MAGRRYPVVSLKRHLDFTRRKQDILRLLTFPAQGKGKIKRLSRSLPPCFRFWLLCSCSWHRLEGKYQRILNHNNTQQQRIKNGAYFAGRYIQMRMRRVHLSIRTEGINAFQNGYGVVVRTGENDTKTICGRKIFLKTEQNSSVFALKRI